MIHIERLPEPDILREKKQAWTEKFLERRANNPKEKPQKSQYAHQEISDTLWRMSHYKCFYCEQSIKANQPEIDHYIEHSLRPELAFEWKNLYGACHDCNAKKKRNDDIPVDTCVDPCDPQTDPAEHLIFSDELIDSKTPQGAQTIKKYALNRDDLDSRRSKKLHEFERRLRKIREEDGSESPREKELLAMCAQPTHPFSLMFIKYLQTERLLAKK